MAFTASSNSTSGFSSGSSNDEDAGKITIQGVAAYAGNAMSYGEVSLIDTHYNKETTTADIDGNFTMSINLGEFHAPFGLRAKDAYGNLVYSILVTAPSAGSSQTINVNPLTSAVVAGAMSSGNPADVFTPATLADVADTDVNNSQTALRTVLQNLISHAGLSNGVDLISSNFVINHSELDWVVSELGVSLSNSQLVLTNELDPSGTGQALAISRDAVQNGTLEAYTFNL